MGLTLVLPLPLQAETRNAETVGPSSNAFCHYPAVPDDIASVSAEGEIVLAAGGPVKLAALRLPDAGPFLDQAVVWLSIHVGVGKRKFVQGPPVRDRWGRRSVRIQSENPGESRDIGRGLIEAGLAIADPAAADAACPDDFLALEATARQRSLGLWADAGYKPIHIDQADRLKDRTGTFAIVEGRVQSVGERAQRTYLNFGGRWADDFTIIIPKKAWRRMTDRGITAAMFKGRQVRVRGILEAWQGPSVTVEIPEMIEWLPR
jgi:hypothetical protein